MSDYRPWRAAELYLPGARRRRRKVGCVTFVLATCKCRQCGTYFAPFADLWTPGRVCAFCAGDRKAGAA